MPDPEIRYAGPDDEPDRYELVERRAAGGEGEVWLAVERHGDQRFRYAVKIIPVDAAEGAVGGSIESLRLQAALATQLEHPALVKVREVFTGAAPHPVGGSVPGRRLYFVMKWIAGRSLQEALDAGELRGLDVLAPLIGVAEAIDYLHSGRDTDGAPVIHRDIKPANILLAGDGRVYLVDFGLVRLRSTDQTSRIFGTAPFMAPESLARGEYTPATDRYTLGATVYYALTGGTPVPGDVDGAAELLTTALGPGAAREVRGILGMLAPTPSARPASAAGWLRALRAAPLETSLHSPAAPPPFVPPPTSGPGRPVSGAGLPPVSGPGLPPVSGPGQFAAPGMPAGLGMPPGPPMLPPSVGGYLGGPGGPGLPGRPPKKRKRWKLPVIIISIVLGVAALCCGGPLALNPYLRSHGYGTDATPTPSHSFDRSKTPPPVTSLHPALVSVGDIGSVMGVDADGVDTSGSSEELYGGLSKLELCSEGTLAGEAIGGSDANTFFVGGAEGYPFVGSSVAGFYSDEATRYFAGLKDTAQRCGWRQLQLGGLGDETYGAYYEPEAGNRTAMVFVRKGQVILQVAVMAEDRGSYQTDAVSLATTAAKRLPAHP